LEAINAGNIADGAAENFANATTTQRNKQAEQYAKVAAVIKDIPVTAPRHQGTITLSSKSRRPDLNTLVSMPEIRHRGARLPDPLSALSAAAEQNNAHEIAALAASLRNHGVTCLSAEIAPILKRAVENNRSQAVKQALTDLPGLQLTLLLDVAVEGNDEALVKHLLRQGAKPGDPDASLPPKMQRLLHAAREVYRHFTNPFQELTQAELRRALLQYDQDEARYARYLAGNSVDRMIQTMQTLTTAAAPQAQIRQLADALTNAPLPVQRQVAANFVLALGARGRFPHTYQRLEERLQDILLLLKDTLAPLFLAPNRPAIRSIMQGILDGIANTPQLSRDMRRTLMTSLGNWCADRALVSDDDIAGTLFDIRTAIQALPEPERKLYGFAECNAYVRSIALNLDHIPDRELHGVVRKLRHCAKHCLGGNLHDMFTATVNRIDARQPSIGEIPKIAHAIWVGEPISEASLKNIAGFMRHNKDYEMIIGTDRPRATQLAIDKLYAESDVESRKLLGKIRVCHIDEWLPEDNEVGDLTKKEIRNLLAVERHGPGRKYAALSDLARSLALRSEKVVNGEKKRGGLYFDMDLQWRRPLPRLSSPLGIMVNFRNNRICNNFIGIPGDTEVLDKLLIDTVHGYRQRNLNTAINNIQSAFPRLEQKIRNENLSFNEGPPVGPTGHDDKYQRDPSLSEQQKQAIHAEKQARALQILERVHPSQNMMDYVRHPREFDDVEDSARYALTAALSGSNRLWNSMLDMFGTNWPNDQRLCKLGAIGGLANRPIAPDQVYTEVSDLRWADAPLARRASVTGTTPYGERDW
jgi:hypothetical protein